MNPRIVAGCLLLLGTIPCIRAESTAVADDSLLSPPLLNSWVPPVYPTKAIEQKLQGTVQLRFVVNESGVVTKARALRSSNPVFEDAAVQSVLQWRFDPAVEGGRKVPKSLDLQFPFELADLKRKTDPKFPPQWAGFTALRLSPSTKAVQKTDRAADYPDSLLPLLLRGEVQVGFTVGPDGLAHAPRVIAATHADFVRPALAAISQWTFQPAMQGDLTVASSMVTAVTFDVSMTRDDRLAACGVTLAEPPDTIAALTRRPQAIVVVDPVYPYDLLLAGTTGDAEVELIINARGRPESVVLRKASDPAFGRALSTAAQAWIFRPAAREDTAVPVKAVLRHTFEAPSGSVDRLTDRLRSGHAADLAAEGLDAPLNPLYRVPPFYPNELRAENVAGEAVVEFVIDRDGRARIAHIISASREEFGWAAATAIEQWLFDPPRRSGQAVDVRVRIPFKFSPPAAANP